VIGLAIVVDAFYLVLDAIVIALGLLFVMKWGKRGLLATTMWLLVIGLMAYAVGDGLYLAGNDLGYGKPFFEGTSYEMESADFAFIAAVVLWIVAFFIPVKFALIDAKKAQGEEQPPQGQPPQIQQGAPAQPPAGQPAPPPQQAGMQAPVPPPVYQQPPRN
jgi:hypothetical protein